MSNRTGLKLVTPGSFGTPMPASKRLDNYLGCNLTKRIKPVEHTDSGSGCSPGDSMP